MYLIHRISKGKEKKKTTGCGVWRIVRPCLIMIKRNVIYKVALDYMEYNGKETVKDALR